MELEEGSHCRYKIRYHIVWKVKYSRRVLLPVNRIKFLKKLIEEIGEIYDYAIEAVGVDENHVHVFVGAHPAIAPAKIIQVIKSITARELFREFPDIKKFLWGGHLWAIGYYVRTVSDGPLDRVIQEYVEDQEKPEHEKRTGKSRYQMRLI